MKKILTALLICMLIAPAAVFADAPSDTEVYETTVAVLSVFGLVFMSSMFGTAPEGVEIDTDMSSGASTMVFENFQVKDFTAGMQEMMQQSEEEIVFNFDSMDGTIAVNEAGDLNLNVQLQGGPVKTLEMLSAGEDLTTLDADGKNYIHLQEMFENMDS